MKNFPYAHNNAGFASQALEMLVVEYYFHDLHHLLSQLQITFFNTDTRVFLTDNHCCAEANAYHDVIEVL